MEWLWKDFSLGKKLHLNQERMYVNTFALHKLNLPHTCFHNLHLSSEHAKLRDSKRGWNKCYYKANPDSDSTTMHVPSAAHVLLIPEWELLWHSLEQWSLTGGSDSSLAMSVFLISVASSTWDKQIQYSERAHTRRRVHCLPICLLPIP